MEILIFFNQCSKYSVILLSTGQSSLQYPYLPEPEMYLPSFSIGAKGKKDFIWVIHSGPEN